MNMAYKTTTVSVSKSQTAIRDLLILAALISFCVLAVVLVAGSVVLDLIARRRK